MPTRAEALASQFEQANNDAIQFVESCSESTWKTPLPNDGRTAGVVAHHIATGDMPISQLVSAIANGQPLPPITQEMINAGNAQHAQQFANVTKAEALDALRQNGATAVVMVRGLTDEQLDRSADFLGSQWTAQQAIERILIGHAQGHTAEMRALG